MINKFLESLKIKDIIIFTLIILLIFINLKKKENFAENKNNVAIKNLNNLSKLIYSKSNKELLLGSFKIDAIKWEDKTKLTPEKMIEKIFEDSYDNFETKLSKKYFKPDYSGACKDYLCQEKLNNIVPKSKIRARPIDIANGNCFNDNQCISGKCEEKPAMNCATSFKPFKMIQGGISDVNECEVDDDCKNRYAIDDLADVNDPDKYLQNPVAKCSIKCKKCSLLPDVGRMQCVRLDGGEKCVLNRQCKSKLCKPDGTCKAESK